MKLKELLALVLLSICFHVNAQKGNYFLFHYTPSDERIDYLTFGMVQDDKGVIYFANKSGILEFDGRNWSLVPTSGPIYTVTTRGQDVFVGGFNGYGKLTWSQENVHSYQSLSQDQPQATQILSSLIINDDVYFLNAQTLYIFSIASGKTETVIKAEPLQGVFTGLFEIAGSVYVGTEAKGLFKIDKGVLVTANLGLPDHLQLQFCSPLKGTDKVLLGGTNNELFSFDPKSGLKQIHVVDTTSLKNNALAGGTWVNEDLIAVGTLRGGVLFINPLTGTTEETINYYSGLPDNEVYAILCDRNQGVWVAHDYGFTRIAPYLPFRSYNHYPGLVGNLLCAHSFKGQLYVGTTVGLFSLVLEEIYEDEASSTLPKNALTGETAKGKKGIFSSVQKDNKKTKRSATKTPGVQNPKKSLHKHIKKPAERILRSRRYVFKQIDGVEGKVSQLIEANGILLASGISGVEEIEGLKARPITRESVRFVFMSPALNQLLVSTLDEKVKSFSWDSKSWNETHLLDTLKDYINYMFEDKYQNIWLCARTSVYKVETDDKMITEILNIPFSNPSIDETVGLSFGNEVYVVASGKFNRYDVTQNKLIRFDSLPGPKKNFASAGYFWFYDGLHWRTVDNRVKGGLNLEWLSLFQNIRYLAPTGNDGGLWVITAGNELYNFSSKKVIFEHEVYPLFLRQIHAQQNKIPLGKTVRVTQNESTVSFEFIQPDYLGMNAIEYRYMVDGLTANWSAWSANNNIVNFGSLPAGEYKLVIQTRDLMGRTRDLVGNKSQSEEIELVVEPPYWRRSWFYALEFAFFSLLVFMSLKLGASNSRYRYLSRLLSVLTVIMLIQFIQTVVSATVVAAELSVKSTPVIDFFVQVFIALLVLPIEGYLRKFMMRSTDGRVETARLWDHKEKG